jgi:8-oxo-dGTP pyrophosphatase MutT (NUDIX family)
MLESSSNTVVKFAWMPVQDRKVLFARSRDQELFYCVGGKPEPDESDHDALVRETWEEAGVCLDPQTIVRLATFVGPGHGKAEGKITVLSLFDASYQGKLEARNEVAELAWLTTADKHRTTVIGGQILDMFASQGKID